MPTTDSHDAPIWTPSPVRRAGSRMAAFLAAAATDSGASLTDYDTLYRWSIDHPERF